MRQIFWDMGDLLNHYLAKDMSETLVVKPARGEADQISWDIFNQTGALKYVPDFNTFLNPLNIWADLLPVGLFLLSSHLLTSHP